MAAIKAARSLWLERLRRLQSIPLARGRDLKHGLAQRPPGSLAGLVASSGSTSLAGTNPKSWGSETAAAKCQALQAGVLLLTPADR